jgi:hypothetical protein
MANLNGLMLPQAFSAPNTPYYLDAAEPVITAPTLVSPIKLAADPDNGSLAEDGVIFVDGTNAGGYTGAINIVPGVNETVADEAGAGITIRTTAGAGGTAATTVEIGTDTQGPNYLYVAGALGVSEVYNPLYNAAVSIKEITLSATNPLCEPDPDNTGEIFRCEQDGVAAAAITAIGTSFTVPETGWYALQMEVKLGNAPAPAATSINVPITVAPGGVNLGETLSFSLLQGVVGEPYGLMEVVSSEFVVSEILVQNAITVRNYCSMHFFNADNTYRFTFKPSSALWNIGATGQIKAELIAMV